MDPYMPPIHRASEQADLRTVIEILKTDPAQVRSIFSQESPNQPLHLAAWQNHPAVAETLLDHGADVNARGEWDRTPLHYAAKNGNLEVAELLVQRGADLEAKDRSGETPLQIVRSLEVAELLLQCGAILDIHSAMRLGKVDVVRFRLKNDPELVAKAPFPDYLLPDAVAMIATRSGIGRRTEADLATGRRVIQEDKDVLEMLIARGAPMTNSYSAMFDAVQLADVTIAKILLEHGARTEPREPTATGLLEVAEHSPCRDEMIELLRRYGVQEAKPDWTVDVSGLIAGLKHKDDKMRYLAAMTLGTYRRTAKQAVPALVEALNDPVPLVAKAAADSLKKIDPDAAAKSGVR